MEEKTIVRIFPVNAGFKVVVSFYDFRANKWQAIVGGYLHCEFDWGMGFI